MKNISDITNNETAIIKKDLSLINEEWYSSLINDCKAIITERSYQSRMAIIEGKWELGERISKENDNFERSKVYGKHIVETLAKDLGISESGLWFCVQFYQEFKGDSFPNVLEKQTWGKDVSWYKITQEYLGKRDDKKGMPRATYKLVEILEAFRNWFITTCSMQYEKEEFLDEINNNIESFKKYLIKLRK